MDFEKVISENENNQEKEKSPQELGEEFLQENETQITDKIKNVLNILRPHELRDSIYKLWGTLTAITGLEMSRIAFLNPEQMNILGRALTSSEDAMAKTLSVLVVLMGGLLFTGGITETMDKIKFDKEYERKKNLKESK